MSSSVLASGNDSMQPTRFVAALVLVCHILSISASTVHQFRSRSQLLRKLHGRNAHPSGLMRELSEKPAELQTFSVIVWGASLRMHKDTNISEGFFCALRYGSPKTSWDQKLRGTGRIGNISNHSTMSPVWNAGAWVIGSDETEVTARIFATDEVEFSSSFLQGRKSMETSRLLGEVTIAIGTLRKVSQHTSSGRASFKLPGGGDVQLSAFRGQFALSDLGILPTSNYETSAPIGGQQSVRLEDMDFSGPMILGTSPLPFGLQGIWWFGGQTSASSLLSFGGPNNDGNGFSLGYLDGPKNTYKIRAEGDRVAMSPQPSGLKKIVDEIGDKVYSFEFNDRVDPTAAHVRVSFEGLDGEVQGKWPERIMNFDMQLMPKGNPEYPGSLVWSRNSSIWMDDYKFVQVMNGRGEKIEPAWSSFVLYEKDPKNRDYPGWMFYKSAVVAESPWEAMVTKEVVQRVRVQTIFLIVCVVVVLIAGVVGCVLGAVRLQQTVRSMDFWQYTKDLAKRRHAFKQSYWINEGRMVRSRQEAGWIVKE